MPRRGRPRPHLHQPERIESLLQRAGEDRFANRRAPFPARIWVFAVGPRVAERSRPISVEGGVLTVRVATSVWANELSLLADSILARLARAGVQARELRFRVGAIEPPAVRAEARASRKVPPPAALPSELASLISGVADKELKEAIALAARSNLAWQTHVKPAPASPATPASGDDADAQRNAAIRSRPSKR